MTTVYLDYVGNGIWALGKEIDMPFPRLNVSKNPQRLVELAREMGWKIICSEAALLMCDHDLSHLSWIDQYRRYLSAEESQSQW